MHYIRFADDITTLANDAKELEKIITKLEEGIWDDNLKKYETR